MRPRGFKLGTMRHLVTIQQPTEALDDYGQPVVTWTNYLVNEPASFRPTGGSETSRGKQLEANVRGVFTVRYRDGYKATMRVVHDSQAYGVLYVDPVDGGRRYIELSVDASGDV